MELISRKEALETSSGGEPDLSKLTISDEKSENRAYPFYNGPLQENFYSVQCPFTWTEVISQNQLEEIVSNSLNLVVGDPKEWQIFCTNIYLAYFKARLGRLDAAFDHLKICEEQLSAQNEFFVGIHEGMNHALSGMEAHIHFIKGDPEEAIVILGKIIPEQDLSGPCRGALLAMHATASHDFGLLPKEENLAKFKEVIKLDPDEKGSRRGAWYFNAGKLIGQIRRIKYRTQVPSEEEFELLERATKYNPFPVSLAVLAEAKREKAVWIKNVRGQRVDKREIDRLYFDAQRLLKLAFKLDDENVSTLRRCGNGLMKLPRPYQDLPLATKILEKAIELDPMNAPAYHALGTLNERHLQNWNKAIQYFKLSADNGNLSAALSLMRVKFKMDKNYNPLKECDEYMKKSEEISLKASFHVTKGEYYLFVKNDLINAAKEWEKAIELAPDSDSIAKHWKLFSGGQVRNYSKDINVYECLKSAIRQRSFVYSEEDEAYLRRMLKICEEHA